MIVTISWRGNNIGNGALYPWEKALYKCKYYYKLIIIIID